MPMLRRLALSLLLAAGLLWLLARWGGVGPSDVLESLGRLDAGTYLLALGIHLCIYLSRSLRFALLVPRAERPGFGAALAVSSAHNLASYVLPAKTGEASLVVYLKAYAGVPAASGLASLLVSRLLDLCVLCAWVVGAVLLLLPSTPALGRLVAVLPVLSLLAIGLGLLCLWPHRGARIATSVLARLGLGRWPAGRAVLQRLDRLIAALESTARSHTQALCLLLTVAQWALVFGFYAVLGRATGLPEDLAYGEAVFGSSLAVLFNLLPVNGFAGFGTQEAGWKIGFTLLGVPADLALSSGLAVHLVQLGNVMALGLLGHLALGLMGGRRGAD